MALRSGLSMWCYTPPSATATQPLVVREYAEPLDSLRFSSVMPGGWGQLTAKLKVTDARIPRPELGLFSRIVLVDGPTILWMGEISESKPGMNTTEEYILVTALGLGAMLRDDPNGPTYNAQTVQQMARAELLQRTTTTHAVPFDPDNTQLFPDNPAGTYGPVYDNKTWEEVLADLCTLASTAASNVYVYGTEAHPTNKDAAGFPTTRVYARLRDVSTVHYQASIAANEVERYELGNSAERAYNAIYIGYNNGAGGISYKNAKDTRLGSDLSQNLAAFRWRKYLRDYSGTTTISAAQAQALANTYLSQYQNITNKSEVWLRAARDANGNPLRLHFLQAGKNILVPEMAVQGQQLPTVPTPGVNLGYIVSFTYSEDATGQLVDLQLDNFADVASYYVARLMLAADTLARSDATILNRQAPNAPETGYCGGNFIATAGAQAGSAGTNYKTVMTNAPTSISLSTVSSVNSTSPGTSNIDVYGFNVTWQSSAGGASTYLAHYTTNGNTILAIDDAAGTFDWHCDWCEKRITAAHEGCLGCAECHEAAIHRGLRLDTHLRATPLPADSSNHGDQGLSITCPACGAVEAFNCQLTEEDEDAEAHGEKHAHQARHIHQAMRHPHVGLVVHGDVLPNTQPRGRMRRKAPTKKKGSGAAA